MSKEKVWFITGASKGMGLTVAKAVLAQGDKVVATSRNRNELLQQLGEANEHFLPLQVDLTSDTDVKRAIAESITAFGSIDIVLNNAGYYLVGSLEDITDKEFRETIDVNLFGTVHVIRHVMPYMRRQQSGHIINIASNMGYIGYTNTGSYNAAKFAVIGLSEALALEAQPFGIKVTVVAPGMFRTGFMGDRTLKITTGRTAADLYKTEAHAGMLRSFDGNQPGDPEKLAAALIHITQHPAPPVHLLLGPDSYASVTAQRKTEADEREQWKHLTLSTNFEEQAS